MRYVTPGTRLCFASEYEAGPGTYERDEYIYSSVVGIVQEFLPTVSSNTVEEKKQSKIITVSREKHQSSIPDVDSIITGKVIRMTTREAVVSIMVVGNIPCKDDYQGIIRSQDVRATEKDKVKIIESYRLGDIVKAEVISLGDARSYYLSTAKNEYGVIYAQSVAGAMMVPISWQKMQCTKTKAVELRKCAKPKDLFSKNQ
ncbi:7694_t:CDS:2 [Diversispora eburnea]|uniref:7694_t:CDS:1 n=1 Tax=Diversispora eburnea TaxID=1213867 RepID=A0A9N8YXE6_9GLOM|nr:7694_t:CDS:2 [Diversispora eburnea]